MVDRGTITRKKSLPQRVMRVLDDDRSAPLPKLISKIDKQDIAVLKKIVSRKIKVPSEARFHRTMATLVDREKSVEVKTLLSKVIADPAELLRNRLCAANQLGRFKADMVEDDLIGNLSVSDPFVKAELIKTIGTLGNAKSLAALDQLPASEEPYLQKQLSFSKALISYRLGLDRDDLPFMKGQTHRPKKSDVLTDMSYRKAVKKTVQARLLKLKGSHYGLNLSKDLGFTLDCGNTNWAVFINKAIQGEDLYSAIKERRYIAGVLSYHEKRTDTYAVQYLVLTNPKKKDIEVSIVRHDGEVCYTGKANSDGKAVPFQMFDVARRGAAPLYVKGQFTLRGIQMDACIPNAKRVNKQAALPVA